MLLQVVVVVTVVMMIGAITLLRGWLLRGRNISGGGSLAEGGALL